jgi:hypothetical protein
MQVGPNMKRLREMDVADTVAMCVMAGPGDLLVWEVRASIDSDGIPLEYVGRGSDLEAAAGAVIPLLVQDGSELQPPDGEDLF